MMKLSIQGISSEWCRAIWQGGRDHYGQQAKRVVAHGPANPCRHCLTLIEPGESKLVLAFRPFVRKSPYAETGPIFLHSEPCTAYNSEAVPGWFKFLDPAIVRGYGADHWIRYETGGVVDGKQISARAQEILRDATVAYVHVRSKFNCFQCRIDRASDHF